MRCWSRAIGLLLLAPLWLGCGGGDGAADAGQDAGQDADGGADGGDLAPADGDGDAGPGDADAGPVELTVTAVLPSRGPVEGGTWANIIGSGFVAGIGDSPFDVRDVTEVLFGDNPAIDIEVIRDDMISVRTPTGLAGPVAVTVENPNGRVSLPDAFTFYAAVRADGVEPAALAAGGGTPFAVQGVGFTPDTSVLIGGRTAAGVVVESPERVTGRAPPGQPGSADVRVVNRNGDDLLFRAVTYHARPRLDALEPPCGPAAGGTAVVASGAGFSPGSALLLGAQAAAAVSIVDDGTLEALTPPGSPGPVDVSLQGAVASDGLAGGFVYLDAADGQLRLLGVSPGAGPAAGGRTVTLVGDGFASHEIQALRFGPAEVADWQVVDERQLRLTTPPGTAGAVAVEVESASDLARLETAYRYFEPLSAGGLEPSAGPAAGGTPFVLSGSGFGPGTQVTFGGVPAAELEIVAADRIEGLTPPGAPGAVDVAVADADSRAVLAAEFTYTTGLELIRVAPDSGAQAGGTYVTLYGHGFAPGMRIWFGDQEAALVQFQSDSTATARTPRGQPGEVTVAVALDGQRVELPAAYAYFDPTNDRGGASGGPIQGAFNVTCLDGSYVSYGAPLPDATVVIAEPALSARTDDRGQVTFSGPSLVRAVTVTAGKPGYESITVADLNAANLSVYLYPNEQEPPDPGQIEVTYSSISGRVFGFKDIPGLPTGPTISHEARIQFTSYSLYSVPPFGSEPRGTPIESDGGRYEFAPLRLGDYSLYALFGAYDSESEQFTPALLGVRRGIQVPSEDPVTGQDVLLTTPLDRSVVVELVEPPLAIDERQPRYGAYVSLDLGADGVIYLNRAQGTGGELVIDRLPAAAGDAFLFVGLASLDGAYPYSYVFRRRDGDLDAGVEMGPFLGFTELVDPPAKGELTDGRIAWTFSGPTPELTQLRIQTAELMPKTLWRVVLPGEVTEIELPAELLSTLPQGEPLMLLLYTANSPRFTFDRFNYGQLSSGRWTAYTVNFTSFSAP